MSQVVVYIDSDVHPDNANDAVIGNSGTIPTITGTRKIVLAYDPAQISMAQLQKAVDVFDEFVEQYCNGANAAGSTYAPYAEP